MLASRRLLTIFILPVAALVALQLVPYGRDHSVPPDGAKPGWSSPQAVELAKRACYDCHSNETRWPWYSNIAPLSWRIFHHVEEGREHLNFSAFDPSNDKVADAAGEAGESVTKQSMPPADYLLAHPEARLTAAERRILAAGLDSTFSAFAEDKGQRAEQSENVGRSDGARGESRESKQEEATEHTVRALGRR
jgi:hypothetical protein